MKQYHRVLTIAGSDSGGGAGIQADIKTISACGCYAASAITAITVQNTLGVQTVMPVPTDIVRQQITAVLDDIGADAVKIGMLHSEEVVLDVADELRKYAIPFVVLDPVMVSTSGHRLIEPSAIEAMTQELFPLARVITPNIPEAEMLLGTSIPDSTEALHESARRLSERFQVSVLLKAGHLSGNDLIDILFDRATDQLLELPSQRIETRNTHGTGCTLSSALASFLALGQSLPDAALSAKAYITRAIRAGAEYEIGHGHGPVKHW